MNQIVATGRVVSVIQAKTGKLRVLVSVAPNEREGKPNAEVWCTFADQIEPQARKRLREGVRLWIRGTVRPQASDPENPCEIGVYVTLFGTLGMARRNNGKQKPQS